MTPEFLQLYNTVIPRPDGLDGSNFRPRPDEPDRSEISPKLSEIVLYNIVKANTQSPLGTRG